MLCGNETQQVKMRARIVKIFMLIKCRAVSIYAPRDGNDKFRAERFKIERVSVFVFEVVSSKLTITIRVFNV